MAPAKNPNTGNKTNSNNVPNSDAANAAASRKQTGTVPKSTTATKSTSTFQNASTENICSPQQQPHGQKPMLQHLPSVAQLASCSPLNVVASIQQQQQQLLRGHQQQQYKNTEVVAPIIRRELKDLNDYLLTTVVTTSNNNPSLQQQNIGAGSTNSDIENSQENQQRFCYPVRPIPRRNQPQSTQHQTIQLQNDFLNAAANTVNSNLNTTIGVVIPHTTPGLSANNSSNVSITQVQPNNSNPNLVVNNSQLPDNSQLEQQIQLLVLQRLRQLFENSQTSPFLNLTTSLLPGIQAASSASLANTILNHNSNELTQLAQRFQNFNNNNQKSNLENSLHSQQKTIKTANMVHEINPTASQNDIVVNSASLEDVPLSDLNDRAQSIQSLHSNIETPTPDTTPSYEELQQRLEASNRNIQSMQDQQHTLLKLQNAAKQHLSDMERLRAQAGTLSFPAGSLRGADGGDGTPEYQSIDQVHSDMASLVGRMKNLTSFIQNQNELSSLLGDDGPEIQAEQEALQRKLDSLRNQRDEMRNIVAELQSVNRSAEESAKEARQRQFEQEKDIEENDQNPTTVAIKVKKFANANGEREVPIEYTRNVPIELLQQAQRPQAQLAQQLNGHNDHSETETDMDEDERKETAELIQQKQADIDAMKAQLKRLKDMMETVNLIETHTAKDPKLVGRTQPREVPIVFDRERTPVAAARYSDDNGNEEFLTRKARMLNDVTSDLRAQAESLQAEKNRIQLLKEEIERRKQQAAAAVQMGDDALKRNSLTPTPIPRSSHEERWEEHLKTQQERDQLKEEYERKKKEFELICKRLDQEDTPNQQAPRTRHDIVSEADDEAEEDNNESDYAESAKFVPIVPTTSTPAASRNNDNARTRTGKDSLNSTGVSSGTHLPLQTDGASIEAASLQSGSSRSFSIPPPMSAMGINFPGPLPHQYYGTGVPAPTHPSQNAYGMTQPTTTTATLSNNDCICTANNLGAATSSSTATSATNNATLANEPMLQLLINSVCQCNQMLWHQQREIDNLNQTIHVLHDRIISLGGLPNADMGYTLRSESVPPISGLPNTHSLPNNLYMSLNRAQSEQPLYLALGQNSRNAGFGNYQQHHGFRRVSQQQPHQPNTVPQAGAYQFSAETQQHNSSSATASMYSTLNNAVPPPASTTIFNNEIPTPQSPVVGGGPAPIFMHHHNNSIHQNNANLRTQNQQQQQQHHHSNVSGSTLNNQVPPGTRANNYWDNFRSYSRQNLLSTNSTKSNEEQQQALLQQQHHNQAETASYERTPHTLQQHAAQQQIYQEQNLNLDDGVGVNNLNYQSNPNNEAASKYLRILQRSRINQQQQQQQYQNMYQQQRDFLQQLNWLEHHQDNNNSNISAAPNNSSDLMYHNYNIQQNNKVGPKPNWRFRNINEEYNPAMNRVQTTLPRYQNTATFPQQQPLSAPQFLNLTQTQAARNHDFLLRPSVDLNDDTNYNFLNTAQQLPLDFSASAPDTIHNQNATQHALQSHHNVNNEDEDDTTSEEIKRNLLVNALKNDKFTTKFYESIKEDVFRRLESMLLDKDNLQQSQQVTAAGACSSTAHAQPQLFNNISNIWLRKLNLNEHRDQMQQQLHQQQQQQPTSFDVTLLQQNVSDDSNTRNDFSNNITNDENVDNENEKPEEDINWLQNNMNNCSAPSTPSQTCSNASAGGTKNCTKKRKNLRKQSLSNNNSVNMNTIAAMPTNDEENNENLTGACSLAAQHHHQQLQDKNKDKQNDNKSPTNATASPTISSVIATTNQTSECDLINYIISRIRNQTHSNTIINDTLLVEVAKLTSTVAQNAKPLTQNNACNNSSTTNISPKKIYTKIKKLTIPKERDEFLRWYQQYLENTLFGCQAEAKPKTTSTSKQANNQRSTQQQKEATNRVAPSVVQQQQQPTSAAAAQDDGDLAEADQNCSSNTSGNYHHLEEDVETTNTLIITANAETHNVETANKVLVMPANMEDACAVVTSSSSAQIDELTNTAAGAEKDDLKAEKQDYNEKD